MFIKYVHEICTQNMYKKYVQKNIVYKICSQKNEWKLIKINWWKLMKNDITL